VVVDAVAIEPVSSRKFPANREKNREFYRVGSLGAISGANKRAIPRTFSKIPYATEQGIILSEQGILTRKQGILSLNVRFAPEADKRVCGSFGR
jgi:hypothetical protein